MKEWPSVQGDNPEGEREKRELTEEERESLHFAPQVEEGPNDPDSSLEKIDIFLGEEKIGGGSFIPDRKEGGVTQFQGLEILPEYRGMGIGKEVYRKLNEDAKKRGQVLTSDIIVSDDAKRVWESLVRSGEAEKLGEGIYRFKREEKKEE
ncbi:MAG: GNAT family N-acetyltransferase [Minisyncoccia bacterium]|jgi:GNAT superfamily N-acetyltransferase